MKETETQYQWPGSFSSRIPRFPSCSVESPAAVVPCLPICSGCFPGCQTPAFTFSITRCPSGLLFLLFISCPRTSRLGLFHFSTLTFLSLFPPLSACLPSLSACLGPRQFYNLFLDSLLLRAFSSRALGLQVARAGRAERMKEKKENDRPRKCLQKAKRG